MIKLPDPEVIARFRDIVAERFGLHFDDTKQDFLGEVLLRRIGLGAATSPGTCKT